METDEIDDQQSIDELLRVIGAIHLVEEKRNIGHKSLVSVELGESVRHRRSVVVLSIGCVMKKHETALTPADIIRIERARGVQPLLPHPAAPTVTSCVERPLPAHVSPLSFDT